MTSSPIVTTQDTSNRSASTKWRDPHETAGHCAALRHHIPGRHGRCPRGHRSNTVRVLDLRLCGMGDRPAVRRPHPPQDSLRLPRRPSWVRGAERRLLHLLRAPGIPPRRVDRGLRLLLELSGYSEVTEAPHGRRCPDASPSTRGRVSYVERAALTGRPPPR